VNTDDLSRSENLESIINQFISNEGIDRFVGELLTIDLKDIEPKEPLPLFWCRYFLSKNQTLKNIPIEVFIERSNSIFDTDLRAICHVLRKFECNGHVVNSTENGYYIRTDEFRSLKTLFLHNQQCTEEFLKSETKNDVVFRIVGYNIVTKRINISLLTEEEINLRNPLKNK
jgi:hypothetical protein